MTDAADQEIIGLGIQIVDKAYRARWKVIPEGSFPESRARELSTIAH